MTLGWVSQNASWIVKAIPTPQVTGVNTVPLVYKLGSMESDSSGGFSVKVVVPPDYGGSHTIQAYALNGTAISPVAAFVLVPHFTITPGSGPAGTPIKVTATGLGIGQGSTNYHLYWDNSYVGSMSAVTTQGSTNVTFYASGTAGRHYISIYEGWPGPGYFNPQQGPVNKPGAQSVYFPPDIPFYANFTVTPEQVVPAGASVGGNPFFVLGSGELESVIFLAGGLATGAVLFYRKETSRRDAVSRMLVAVVIIVLVAVAGVGAYLASGSSALNSQSSTSQQSAGPRVTFNPVVIVDRPPISVPVNNVTTGPRIGVSPDIASVGDQVTVTGMGFSPNQPLPLVWTTRQGGNIYGYKLVSLSLRNVTADASGSFSFTMKVPSDLGGVHYVAAGNLTRNSNGTLFIQRTARISATQGPDGTQIQIILQGVGWDFNTNIATFDYDNSYEGYGCGFNSGGNVTFTLLATGPPGIHTIDVYPSVWWGPSNFANQLVVEYRYPILTPQDHPELMPAFHFTFLVTSS